MAEAAVHSWRGASWGWTLSFLCEHLPVCWGQGHGHPQNSDTEWKDVGRWGPARSQHS